MKKQLLIILILLHIGCLSICMGQKQILDGVYLTEEKCNLNIFYTSKDTIKATGNFTCNALNIDTLIDATWLLYTKEDTSCLFYQVSIKNHKKNGNEIWYLGKDGGFYDYKSYLNGLLHGPSIRLRLDGIESISFYLNGEKTGMSYYNYDCTGVKEESFYHCKAEEGYVFYNKKGKGKKYIILFPKKDQ